MDVPTLLNRGNLHHRRGEAEPAARDWAVAAVAGGERILRLFQVRSHLAGHYDGAFDGRPSDALARAIAACSRDPDCGPPSAQTYCDVAGIEPCQSPYVHVEGR